MFDVGPVSRLAPLCSQCGQDGGAGGVLCRLEEPQNTGRHIMRMNRTQEPPQIGADRLRRLSKPKWLAGGHLRLIGVTTSCFA